MNDITSRRHDDETRRVNWTFTIICGVALLFIGGVTGAFLVDFYWHIHESPVATTPAPSPAPVVIQKPSPAVVVQPAPETRVEPELVQTALPEVRPEPVPVRSPEQCTPEGDAAGVPCTRRPLVRIKTFSFMPGQTMSVPNRTFQKVEVRSEYPLRVYTGTCHSDYTVQFFCKDGPNDIFISDVRRVPIFMTPRANSITITVIEY